VQLQVWAIAEGVTWAMERCWVLAWALAERVKRRMVLMIEELVISAIPEVVGEEV
jgi:hypothetical protein